MAAAVRIAAIVAWVGGMVALTTWSNTDAATAAAVAATFAVGVIVGRWPLLLVAIVPGLALALMTAVADPDDFHDASPLFWAGYVLVIAAAVTGLLALGVGVHRLVRSAVAARGRRR